MMIRSRIVAFVLSFTALFSTVVAGEQKESSRRRHLDCFWTDTSPVLDGKMDDACWRQAQVANAFVLLQTDKEPTNATEVRTCYDADNLYLFFTLHEKDMTKLKYGPPEDIRDNLDWTGDVAEIFLSPNRNDEYYQLCASPQGARHDAFIRDKFFNPDWRVVPGIHKDRWTLEIAIPFASLARDGEFHGTPAADDVWGIQFCRDQGPLREWSSWRTREYRSFHYPEYFGTLRFAGRKDGKSAPSAKLVSGEIFFGAKQKFEFQLDALPSGLKAIVELTVDGQATVKREVAIASNRFALDFPVLQGGDWEFSIDVFQDKQKIYRGFGLRALPPVVETFKTMAATKIGKELSDSDYPGRNSLLAEAEKLKAQSVAAAKQLDNPGQLTDARWRELIDLYRQVETAWQKTCFKLNLVKLYAKTGGSDAPFALGQTGPQTKIHPDTLYEGPVNQPVRISLAGGETRSLQLIMIPFGEKLENVAVEFSPLQGENNTAISSDNCRWFAIDYVTIDQRPAIRETFYHKIQPDILREKMRFDVPADTLRPLWLDIYLPAGMPTGLYRGTITVRAEGDSAIAVPLEVTAYGFDLPERTTLKNEFWFYPSRWWEKFYGGFGKNGYSPELHREHAQILSRYRVNPFLFGQVTYWEPGNIKIFREKDGSFTFDLSQMERFLDNGIEFGGNVFCASMGCNTTNALGQFVRNHLVHDRATGKTARLYDCYPEMREFQTMFKEQRFVAALESNRLYLDFMKVYLELLKRKNLLAEAGWEYFDEPNSNVRWHQMLETHAFFRSRFPEMRLFFYGGEPERSQDGRKSIGYVDEWAPGLSKLADTKMLNAIKSRREKFGEKFMFYTCSTAEFQGNTTPFMQYHHSYLGPRMHAWMAYKLDADGFMSYMLNSVNVENMPDSKKKMPLWPDTAWRAGKWQGTGTLIYPGPDYQLIPSMRLASFRDGLQDYEYFVLLRNLQRYIDKDEHPDLYAQIDRELTIEPAIIETVYVWTKDEYLLEAKRSRLAALIELAKKHIKEPIAKLPVAARSFAIDSEK